MSFNYRALTDGCIGAFTTIKLQMNFVIQRSITTAVQGSYYPITSIVADHPVFEMARAVLERQVAGIFSRWLVSSSRTTCLLD